MYKAVDICRKIGISYNGGYSLKSKHINIDDFEYKKDSTNGGEQTTIFLNNIWLLKLIFNSKPKQASFKQFKQSFVNQLSYMPFSIKEMIESFDFDIPNTKCYLYLAICNDKIKIGASINPEERIKQLQTGNPNEIKLLCYCEIDSIKNELALHKKLKNWSIKGEWYNINILKEINNYDSNLFKETDKGI